MQRGSARQRLRCPAARDGPLRVRRAAPRGAVRGFTLLELIVVLAIVGMLLAVVPVSYPRMRESADYRNTIRTMTAELSEARRTAAATGRDVAFTIDLGRRGFGVEGRPLRALPERVDVRVVAAETEFRDGVARIRFFPTGNSTGGTIDVLRPSGTGTRLHADWLDGRVSLQGLAP